MNRRIILLTTLFFCCTASLFAKHIIGGIITYEYKDNGVYNFTMKIYRDCNGQGAEFDGDTGDNTAPNAAILGLFRETNGVYQLVESKFIKLGSKSKVIPPSYPCMGLPPNVCVEEGIYNFDFKISDFPSKSTYHVVYQRCCRNNTIANIVNSKDVGATYTVAITPEAMVAKSSSPVFKNFPPTIICSAIPFEFDHSATDADGDQLVYKICSPLEGGGPDLSSGGANTCLGVRPNPVCPPPFNNVKFANGYSSVKPLGLNANFSINANTGLLSCQPTTVGQFVVGICVEEYRNGVLLSKVFRDFQFNVGACDALVSAGLKAQDTSIVQKKFVVRSCGMDEVTFQNGSSQEKFIENYLWNFNIAGKTVSVTDKNPTIKFPGLGIYTGILVTNPGKKKPCTDTAKIEVQVYPGIKANYRYEYDTCIAGPIKLTDLSVSNAGAITEWEWTNFDGTKVKTQNPELIPKVPGYLKVKLKVKDKNLCEDTTSRVLRYFPVPPLIVIKPDTTKGCTPLTVKINNLSYPIDKSYSINWDMGDGTTSNDINPIKKYEKAGIYSLNLKLVSPIGCKTEANFPNLIEVRQSPEADFSYTPDKLNSLQSIATFTDKSIGANKWSWQFGKGEGTSIQRNPIYNFQDTGVHVVRLIVTHPSGCRDTAIQRIDIEPIVTFFMPNAFTPNYDSKNDEFKGKGITEGIETFKMTIFNRWGERIFETNKIDEGWNGRLNNTGEYAPDGVYVYTVSFVGPRQKIYNYKGVATLLR